MVQLIAQISNQQNQYFVRNVLLWQRMLWKHTGMNLNLAGSRNMLQMKAHNCLSRMRGTGLKQHEIRLGFYGFTVHFFSKFYIFKSINNTLSDCFYFWVVVEFLSKKKPVIFSYTAWILTLKIFRFFTTFGKYAWLKIAVGDSIILV